MKLDHVARQAWLRQQGRNSDVVTSLEKLEVNTAPPASASWAAEGLFGRASGAGGLAAGALLRLTPRPRYISFPDKTILPLAPFLFS